MKGQTIIKTNGKQLWVRFEKIGHKAKFTQYLNLWQQEFPQSVWNEEHKAQELSIYNLDRVIQFCLRMSLEIKIEHFASSYRQLELMNFPKVGRADED